MDVIKPEKPQQTMSDGTATKPLYIKHFALSDWQLVDEFKKSMNTQCIADVIRHLIRKGAGRV